jgi:hypothetical protein
MCTHRSVARAQDSDANLRLFVMMGGLRSGRTSDKSRWWQGLFSGVAEDKGQQAGFSGQMGRPTSSSIDRFGATGHKRITYNSCVGSLEL